MSSIKLEFDKIQILKKRESWKIYFIVVTEHPNDKDKMLVSSFPDPHIKMKSKQDNEISFVPESTDGGADGLFVIQREMPANKSLKVRVYLRHDRQGVRNVGKLLQNMKEELGVDGLEIVSDILGSTNPWLVITKKAVPLIGSILTKIKDKGFGFVNMDEDFGEEFNIKNKLGRSNNFSTGNAKINWSWTVKK